MRQDQGEACYAGGFGAEDAVAEVCEGEVVFAEESALGGGPSAFGTYGEGAGGSNAEGVEVGGGFVVIERDTE